MPELPEVETIRRQLEQVLPGRVISAVEVLKAKSWSGDVKRVENQAVQSISRRGKVLIMNLKSQDCLVIHLKMSGQLIFVDGDRRVGGGHPTDDWVSTLPSKHTRVVLHFTDGTHVYFNDQRMFGWMRVMSEAEVHDALRKLAPDVIDAKITVPYLLAAAQKRRIPTKQFIMDNEVVAGVGNIYACDALNLAKISPTRPTNALQEEEVVRLLAAMREVITLGIKKGGATVHGKYVHVTGLAGHYQEVLRVYNRSGESCPNCTGTIIKIRLGGRGTYYCPQCQK